MWRLCLCVVYVMYIPDYEGRLLRSCRPITVLPLVFRSDHFLCELLCRIHLIIIFVTYNYTAHLFTFAVTLHFLVCTLDECFLYLSDSAILRSGVSDIPTNHPQTSNPTPNLPPSCLLVLLLRLSYIVYTIVLLMYVWNRLGFSVPSVHP